MAKKKTRGRPRKYANKGSNSTEDSTDNHSNIPQSQDARRTRSIEEIQGIPALELLSTSAIGTPPQQRLIEVVTPEGNTVIQPESQPSGNRPWTALFPVNGHDLSTGN